jgi:hypothetical protein
MYWIQMSRFHLKTEKEPNLRNVMFWIKDRTVDKFLKSVTFGAQSSVLSKKFFCSQDIEISNSVEVDKLLALWAIIVVSRSTLFNDVDSFVITF